MSGNDLPQHPPSSFRLSEDPEADVALAEAVKDLAADQADPVSAKVLLQQAVYDAIRLNTVKDPAIRVPLVKLLTMVLRRLEARQLPDEDLVRALNASDLGLLQMVFERVSDEVPQVVTGREPSSPAGHRPSADSTAERVAFRLAQLRDDQDLTLNDLSERLSGIGVPMSPSTLSKMEKGQRRITVEALLALAVAFDISPNWILLPPTADHESHVVIGDIVWPSKHAWQWALADTPAGVSASIANKYDFLVAPTGTTNAWSLWMAAQLQQEGCRVFHPELIELGERFEDAMAMAVEASDTVLVTIGEGSGKTLAWWEWVARAVRRGKRVVPVMVGPDSSYTELPREAKDLLGDRMSLSLHAYDEAAAEHEVRSLLSLVHRPRLEAPPFPG